MQKLHSARYVYTVCTNLLTTLGAVNLFRITFDSARNRKTSRWGRRLVTGGNRVAAHLRKTSLKFRRASHFKFGYGCAFAAIVFSLVAVAARIDEDDATTGLVKGFGELHYLYRASENLYSGSQPASEEAFAQLKRLGIHTIVSVDGAQPDLELASTYGFTYIHIPIGYDGIPAEAAASMAKALRTNTGPFYIHCHHGRHRSYLGSDQVV